MQTSGHRRGQRIGPYQVVDFIGKGGQGSVYLVKDVTGVVWALKAGGRPAAEFSIASLPHHPNLVFVKELGPNYVVEEYVAGQSLAEYLEQLGPRNSLHTDRAVEIAIQISNALHHLHRHGLLHGDIKPANIRLDSREKGRAKLVDYGMTRPVPVDFTSDPEGTVEYLAPEVFQGSVDEQSELWSLGVVLYEMLCGVRPFQGATINALQTSVLYGGATPVAPARRSNGRVSEELSSICLRLLERDRNKRYRTAKEVAEALQCVILRSDQPLPEYYVEPTGEIATAKAHLLGDDKSPVTALVGMCGSGKTTIALALARDHDIREHFRENVFWVGVGPEATAATFAQTMRDLLRRCGAPVCDYETLEACTTSARAVLGNRRALLILDDVWDVRLIAGLISNEGRWRTLVTSRQISLATAVRASVQTIEGLDKQASLMLLLKAAGLKGCVPSEAAEVARLCGYSPLVLAIVGSSLRLSQSWDRMYEVLRSGNVSRLDDVLDRQTADYRHPGVRAAVGMSLRNLSAPLQSRYLDLAVFPPETPIPVAALARMWGCLGPEAAKDAGRFVALSLLIPSNTGHYRLHALHSYFLRSNTADTTGALHNRLLDGYRAGCPAGWASGPDDGYFDHHLSFHLANAGGDMTEILLDPAWLRRRTRLGRIADLLVDFDQTTSASPDICLLRRAVELSAHALTRDPSLLCSQLTGRLEGIESRALHVFLQKLVQSQRQPWLDCGAGALVSAGEKLLRVIEGHTGAVTSVAFMADGLSAVSGSGDHAVRLWNLQSGEIERTFEGHTRSVESVAVAPNGQWIASGGRDGTVHIWSCMAKACTRRLTEHRGAVESVAATPDSRRVVSASQDTLRIWDVETGSCLGTCHSAEAGAGFLAVAVFPDGDRVVSGDANGRVEVWRMKAEDRVGILNGHTEPVTSVAVAPDGRYIASGSRDGVVMLWDAGTFNCVRILNSHTDRVHSVAFGGDGCVVTASSDRTVQVTRVESGAMIAELVGHSGPVLAVAVHPDGQTLLTGSSDRTMRLWSTENSGGASIARRGRTSSVVRPFTPGSRRKMDATSRNVSFNDRMLYVWDCGREPLAAFAAEHPIVGAVALSDSSFQFTDSTGVTHTLKLREGVNPRRIRRPHWWTALPRRWWDRMARSFTGVG